MTKPGVTAVGGVFFKARDPEMIQEWYAKHLGLRAEDTWKSGSTVWAVFPETSNYFDPSQKPFMINYRVRDLVGLLAELEQAGVAVGEKIRVEETGRFCWIMDPEGNRIELWEPAEGG